MEHEITMWDIRKFICKFMKDNKGKKGLCIWGLDAHMIENGSCIYCYHVIFTSKPKLGSVRELQYVEASNI